MGIENLLPMFPQPYTLPGLPALNPAPWDMPRPVTPEPALKPADFENILAAVFYSIERNCGTGTLSPILDDIMWPQRGARLADVLKWWHDIVESDKAERAAKENASVTK